MPEIINNYKIQPSTVTSTTLKPLVTPLTRYTSRFGMLIDSTIFRAYLRLFLPDGKRILY